MAASFHGVPWMLKGSFGFDNNPWSLYKIDEDFSEANDLANQYPARLAELQAIFDQEANKFQVYPLDDRAVERVLNPNRPSVTAGRKSFRYTAGTTRILEGSAPASEVYRKQAPFAFTGKIEEVRFDLE